MRFNLWIFILAVLVLFLFGCTSNSPIDSEYDILEKLNFVDMNDELRQGFGCIDFGDEQKLEFVIRNDVDYSNFVDNRLDHDYCLSYEFPSVDFSNYVLVGKYADGSGCSVDFDRSAYLDSSNRKIIYVIDVKSQGACDMLASSMNWALVPRHDNFEIVFDVNS